MFGPVAENNDENVEEEPEEEEEEEPEEDQEPEEDTSSTEEEEEEADDDESDPWRALRQKVGEDIKEPYLKEVQQFLDRRIPKPMPKMLLSMPYYL